MSHDCGCCTTPAAAVPGEVRNRPWLSAVAYRIGTFATFRKAIFDELSRTPALASLTARVPDDYTITTIELWAAVADVISFYQERIANDAFLRTATDRDPLLRLVRLIDYQLAPGAAATVELAFTLDAGSSALIPARTRVQSVPAEGEKPQKFETLAAVLAKAALNRLRILPAPGPITIAGAASASPTSAGRTSAIVAPDPDALSSAAALAAGDRVALFSPEALEVLTVRELVSRDDALTIAWTAPIAGTSFGLAFDGADPAAAAYKLGRAFHLFGFDAIPRVVVPDSKVIGGVTHYYLTQLDTDYSLHGDGTAPSQISLDARYDGLHPGSVLLAVAAPGGSPVRAYPFRLETASETQARRFALPSPPTPIVTSSGTVTRVTVTPLTSKTLSDLVTTGDIRDVVVYELLGDPLRLWPYVFDSHVMGGDVFLPGRRTGASAIEVGRTVEKGAYKRGTVIDVSELERNRRVLLVDAGGQTPIGASIVAAALVGTNIDIAPAGTDPTIERIGFGSEQAARTTVIASRRLPAPVSFPNARREVTVRIGALPAQAITLSAALVAGGAIEDVAAALQAAIRAAVPGAPTYARALAWVIDSAIVVAPGIPGDAVSFGPSATDADTIGALGLGYGDVAYLDGRVSAPVATLVGSAVAGAVTVTVGIVPPLTRAISAGPITSVAALATAMAAAFSFTGPAGQLVRISTKVTADDRIILLPPLNLHAPRTFLRLSLDPDGPFALDAATSALLGNVAPASHGETVPNEIVGDGDAATPFQRFTLKKKPITYVPAAAPGGVASSVEVFVNGIRWTEVPTLYTAGPLDQVFTTRIADGGTLTLQFGDGVTGSRLPTGRENVGARYRSGTGLGGRVRAGTIATLLDRPTGVKGVTNLKPSEGGAEPETMARARSAAPGTVRTFGRAVALRDFEDTALMAGEVAKAIATWVWTGERRAIHVTIAAQAGGTFSADGLARLRATLATERDPNHTLIIDNYTPVAVVIAASVIVDERRVADDVLAAARAALLDALSFDRREFAQPVYLSDIVSVLQNVDGVVAVDLDTLDLKSADPAFRLGHGVDPALGQPQPRLLMLPARPAGSPGVVLPAELAWIEAPSEDVTLRAVGGISL